MSDLEIQEGYLRRRNRALEGGDADNRAYAEYISHAPAIPMGHTEVTVGTTPTLLPSVPANARRVVLHSMTENLTYTDDGSDPSATHGMIIPEGVVFIYDTDPDENFKMWCPAASIVRIAYYG